MVFLGADHGGFRIKEGIRAWLVSGGRAVGDMGPRQLEPNDDYPLVAERVARMVGRNASHRGILFCRSGNGVAMAANKLPGIRAAVAFDVRAATSARRDEDANVLALAADRLSLNLAIRIVNAFLTTPFTGAVRHRRRIWELRRIDARYRRPRD